MILYPMRNKLLHRLVLHPHHAVHYPYRLHLQTLKYNHVIKIKTTIGSILFCYNDADCWKAYATIKKQYSLMITILPITMLTTITKLLSLCTKQLEYSSETCA